MNGVILQGYGLEEVQFLFTERNLYAEIGEGFFCESVFERGVGGIRMKKLLEYTVCYKGKRLLRFGWGKYSNLR